MEDNWLLNWYKSRNDLLDKNLKEYTTSPLYYWEKMNFEQQQQNNATGLKLSTDWKSNLLDYIKHSLKQIKVNTVKQKSDVDKLPKDVQNEIANELNRPGWLDGIYYPQHGQVVLMPWGRPSIKTHEKTHGLTIPSELYKIYTIINGKSVKKPDGWSVLRPEITPDAYYDNPDEIKSRLMEFRQYNQIDPLHVFTIEEIPELRKKAVHIFDTNTETPEGNFIYRKRFPDEIIDFDILNRYNDETILKLLNEVAHVPTKVTKVQYTSNGGKINYLNLMGNGR